MFPNPVKPIYELVYDRNHYFGLDPTPKPKLADTVTDIETTFHREYQVTNSTGWISDIWKKVQANILKEPLCIGATERVLSSGWLWLDMLPKALWGL